uniref:Uncharacterized protein n=1 Tax=Anguilla anguilla TaxID=7936 RepID=A0A0E9TPR9_ANGAN
MFSNFLSDHHDITLNKIICFAPIYLFLF